MDVTPSFNLNFCYALFPSSPDKNSTLHHHPRNVTTRWKTIYSWFEFSLPRSGLPGDPQAPGLRLTETSSAGARGG